MRTNKKAPEGTFLLTIKVIHESIISKLKRTDKPKHIGWRELEAMRHQSTLDAYVAAKGLRGQHEEH